MTGSGAVGSPLINPIKSGRAKKPARTNSKKDILFKVSKSVKEVAPMIRKIIPSTISPTTKAKVSNIVTASAEGLAPKASAISISLNSDEKIDKNKGMPWIKIRKAQILKIVLIFISVWFILNSI